MAARSVASAQKKLKALFETKLLDLAKKALSGQPGQAGGNLDAKVREAAIALLISCEEEKLTRVHIAGAADSEAAETLGGRIGFHAPARQSYARLRKGGDRKVDTTTLGDLLQMTYYDGIDGSLDDADARARGFGADDTPQAPLLYSALKQLLDNGTVPDAVIIKNGIKGAMEAQLSPGVLKKNAELCPNEFHSTIETCLRNVARDLDIRDVPAPAKKKAA